MTDDEQQLLKVGAESAFKPFANLIERLFGGPVDQVGGIWEDRLKVRRQIRQVKLMQKLSAALKEAKIDAQPIPDSIWIPVLQEASLQDDETLQSQWANLLANAADPRQLNPVLPSFPAILKELTPREVKFLCALRARGDGPARWGPDGKAGPQDSQIYDRGRLQEIYARAGLARCSRLGRVTHGVHSDQENEDIMLDEREFSIVLDVLKRHGIVEELTYPASGYGMDTRLLHKYALSELGVAFVDACQSAKATPDTPER